LLLPLLLNIKPQVLGQPLFATIEDILLRCFPGLASLKEWAVRAVYRSVYVVFSGVMAIALPFFSSIVGLIGAVSYWPTAGKLASCLVSRAYCLRFRS
jgi:hypothetical protein